MILSNRGDKLALSLRPQLADTIVDHFNMKLFCMQSLLLAALTVILVGVPSAVAQTYPDRPIRIIVPSPPGSTMDNIARFIAEELRTAMGQPIVIENPPDETDMRGRTGPSSQGSTASQAVKRALPDGYTILLATHTSHAVNPATHHTLSYDPEKDFVPIAGIIRIPHLLVVRKSFPANNVPELIKLAMDRAENQPLTYGTDSPSSRVAAELLKAAGNIVMTAVSYQTAVPALQDVVGGRVDIFFAEPLATAGFVASREVKLLAVTDVARVPLVSDVPTMAEAGFQEVRLVNWAAMFAPAGTNAAVVARLNREINAILGKPATKESFQRIGAMPLLMSPPELRLFLHEEIERWKTLARLARISMK